MTLGTPHVFVGSTDGMLRAYVMNEADGSLQEAGTEDAGSLDFFTVGPDGTTVFVSAGSSVSAYAYDRGDQSFSLIDEASTSGGGTHVTVDPTGGYVFVAHYNEGALSFHSFSSADGFGPEQAFSPGDNAHQARVDASGTHVYVPCLGSNHVAQYSLDGGSLTALTPATVTAAGGPRHFDFHPSQPVAYVVAELTSEVHVFDVGASGLLTPRGGASVFTHADEQYHWSSDIKVTPDGAHLYAVNRDPSEIVLFSIGSDQNATRVSSAALGGPVRSFAMDPKGKYLQVGGDDGVLRSFAIGAEGSLTPGPQTTNLGNIRNAEIHYLP
jgi:6-phosphogluconolactonase